MVTVNRSAVISVAQNLVICGTAAGGAAALSAASGFEAIAVAFRDFQIFLLDFLPGCLVTE